MAGLAARHADAIKDHAGRDHSRVARGAALSSEHRGQCSEVRAKNPTHFCAFCAKNMKGRKVKVHTRGCGGGRVRSESRSEQNPRLGPAHTPARVRRDVAPRMRDGHAHGGSEIRMVSDTLRSVLGSFSTLTPSKKLGSFSPKYSRTTTHLNARISTISSEAMLHKLAIRLSNSISRRDAFLLLHTPLSHSAMARSLGGQRA